jgi:hypothetical protein
MERARDRIARSGSATETDTGEILHFLEEAELAGFSACYLFLSADTPGLAAKMKEVSLQSPIDLHAVFVVPGFDRSPVNAGRIQQLLWKPKSKRQDRALLMAAVARLSSFFKTSVVCDLATGDLV